VKLVFTNSKELGQGDVLGEQNLPDQLVMLVHMEAILYGSKIDLLVDHMGRFAGRQWRS